MRGLRWLALLLIATMVAGLAAIAVLSRQEPPAPATSSLNDAAARIASAWPHPEQADLGALREDLRLVDASGREIPLDGAPVGQAGGAAGLGTLVWSAEHRPLTTPVVVDGSVVAWLSLDDGYPAGAGAGRRAMAWASAGTVLAAVLVAATAILWLRSRVLMPFHRMERFAARVAAWDLSAPLEMDREHAFGAWTESFDLMRAELEASRLREAAERASKEALIAQIGHDLRTPVATISATAELLALESGPGRDDGGGRNAERLAIIQSKSAQIDALITDLVRAHRARVADLPIDLEDMSCAEVTRMLREADHRGLARIHPGPDALVRADRLRLAQVIDNVLQNSYKYAGTPLAVRAEIEADCLRLSLTDSGPGVDPDETGIIFARGQRGRGATGKPGQGLGLFTSAQLMDKMGGHIEASLPARGGLRITLTLPLS
ncbi:HAMP domain-containing sensor histidine kinase [Actinomyces timonensis]|uniref:HAMP domain-containing sensor histidine kinase n=1 Tax=Actinomyces timonensis TaxID=1288391 RepID=UPI00031242CB|nr:HAMP domain-containing sensor histidine kinase [Actinomyces timonensis]